MYPCFPLLMLKGNLWEVKENYRYTPQSYSWNAPQVLFLPKIFPYPSNLLNAPYSFEVLYICKAYLYPSYGERLQDKRGRAGQRGIQKELVGSCMWLAGESPNRKVLPGLQKWERSSISYFSSIQFQELGCQERTNCGSATITILNIFLKAYLENGPSPQQHSLSCNSCIFL